MHIQQVSCKNFQNHKELSLDLSHDLNFIIGQSDIGKSAVRRMIQWCALNKPDGDGFRTYNSKETSVKIDTDEGFVVRTRSNSKNDYETPFGLSTKIGKTIPDDVRKVLPLDDINFQSQHDSPFLISLNQTEIGRKLSEFVDLDIMEELQRRVKSELTNITKTINTLGQEQFVAEKELEKLPDIDEVELSAKKINTLSDNIDRIGGEISALDVFISELAGVEAKLQNLPDYDKLIEKVNKLIASATNINKINNKKETLIAIIGSISNAVSEIKRKEQCLTLLEKVNNLLRRNENLDRKESDINSLDIRILDYKKISNLIKEQINEIARTERELKELLSVCPLCGRSDVYSN